MGLRARILSVVAELGPMKRTVMEGLARTPTQVVKFDLILENMLKRGDLVQIGSKRGTRYGLPRRRGR